MNMQLDEWEIVEIKKGDNVSIELNCWVPQNLSLLGQISSYNKKRKSRFAQEKRNFGRKLKSTNVQW